VVDRGRLRTFLLTVLCQSLVAFLEQLFLIDLLVRPPYEPLDLDQSDIATDQGDRSPYLIRVGLIQVDLIIEEEFHIQDVPFGSKSSLVAPKLFLVRCNCLELVLK
jgi:hypothetical protein